MHLQKSSNAGIRNPGKAAGCSILILLCYPIHAENRTSANYEILTDTVNVDGGSGTSADYVNDGAAGGATGISKSTSGDIFLNSGYIGQLYDITELLIGASSTTLNESATTQLEAHQRLDDDTIITLEDSDVIWSVEGGPLTGIDTNGLVTAGTVYQDTTATARGDFAGLTGSLELTVLDSIQDNFGTYASDGLADDWQVQYFGENNPLAGPLLDPDGDGHSNRFEYIAGLVPTDPLSRFLITIAPVPGEALQKQIAFSPLVPGRSYVVKSSPNLNPASWTALSGAEINDEGSERTVIDTTATTARKFYTVEIKKP